MEYKASLDLRAKLITGFVVGFLVVCIGLFIRVSLNSQTTGLIIIFFFVSIGIAVIPLVCYLKQPLKYSLDHEKVTIHRRYKSLYIPYVEITDAFVVLNSYMQNLERHAGNGGMFGYWGDFGSSLGEVVLFASQLRNFLMIKTTDREQIILTPDDIQMINELRKRAGIALEHVSN